MNQNKNGIQCRKICGRGACQRFVAYTKRKMAIELNHFAEGFIYKKIYYFQELHMSTTFH